MNNNYARAYTEVLEILNYFPKEEYAKIPNEKIEFYRNNMDYNYKFSIDLDSDLFEEKISKEARCIILILFRDYLATEKQKKIMENILHQNQLKREKELREKYNPDDIFKRNNIETKNEQNTYENNVNIVKYKESWLKKIINNIKDKFNK